MKFLIFISTIFLFGIAPQFDVIGCYKYSDRGHHLEYEIRKDSTFTHTWSDGCQEVTIKGRWKVHGDTIDLFGSKRDKDKSEVDLLEGIIDTQLLISSDGLHIISDDLSNDNILVKEK